MRDLFVNAFGRQPLHHDCGYVMLEHETINSAHHYDDVENDNQRGHRSAETKTAVQYHERDCQQRQPDVRPQPALHRADAPEHNFFPDTEERGEDEDRQCDGTEDQTERRTADSVMFRRFLE